MPDPRSLELAPGPPGARGGCAALARIVCTLGPGPATAPPPCLGASARGRSSTKVEDDVCPVDVDILFPGGNKAMYVVGGAGTAGYTAEILHADGTSWCSKKLFSKPHYFHTMSGMTGCGGHGSENKGSLKKRLMRK